MWSELNCEKENLNIAMKIAKWKKQAHITAVCVKSLNLDYKNGLMNEIQAENRSELKFPNELFVKNKYCNENLNISMKISKWKTSKIL